MGPMRTFVTRSLALLFLSLLVVWLMFLHEKAPELLAMVSAYKARRHEPRIILAVFLVMVAAAPLALIPSGAIMISGMAVGYLYGVQGVVIAWPGFSLGLLLIFCLSRCGAGCCTATTSHSRGDTPQADYGMVKEAEKEDSCKDASDGGCCQSREAHAFFRVARRIVKEKPKRAAVLLTFASHSPFAMFLLGYGTDISLCPAVLAAFVDGFKLVPGILKGAMISDIADILTDGQGDDKSNGKHWSSLVLTLAIFVSVSVVICYSVQAVSRELQEDRDCQETVVVGGSDA